MTHSEATNGPVHVCGGRDVCLTSQRLYLGAEVWGHVLSLSFRGVLQSTCTPQLRPRFSVPRGSDLHFPDNSSAFAGAFQPFVSVSAEISVQTVCPF